MARLALTGEADIDRDAASAADALHDEAAVERAAAHFEVTEWGDAATALRDYLAARREGRWTPIGEAQGYASLVAQAAIDLRQAEVEAAAAEAAPPPEPPPKPKGIFAAVRGFFGGGGASGN